MVYSISMAATHQVEETLRTDFHDTTMIWSKGSDRRRVYHKYFCINRTTNPAWTHRLNFSQWPGGDPNLIFPNTIYNFTGHKNIWWDLLNVDGKNETHYTKLKFGSTWIMQQNQQCDWLQDWWSDFSINNTAIDPVYYESYFQLHCDWCLDRKSVV